MNNASTHCYYYYCFSSLSIHGEGINRKEEVFDGTPTTIWLFVGGFRGLDATLAENGTLQLLELWGPENAALSCAGGEKAM